MIAVALRWRWPQRYRDDFFAILLSDGIGMGLMQKGKLFTGTHSSGGEFGHMIHQPGGALCRCGRRGCVEAYAGNYAVVRAATGGDESDTPPDDIPETEMEALAERARAGAGPERDAFLRAGGAIGYGLGSLFALFDPAPVAVVGPGAMAFDILETPIREAIAQTAGGQHSGAISFATEPDEMPLIREGSAMTALTALDEEIAAPVATSARREVA
jgi:predicted NBD/HSP70 family sugar kinase